MIYSSLFKEIYFVANVPLKLHNAANTYLINLNRLNNLNHAFSLTI